MMRLSAVVVAWAVALTAPPLVHAKEVLVKGGILVEESYQNLFYQTTATPLEGRRLLDDQIPILDVIARAFILSDVEAYLGVGQLVAEMSVTGPITFFPVWDTGFERFDADLILKFQDRSRKWSGHVRDLMQYHLYEGDLSPELLTASQTVVMANGEEMTLTQDGAGRIFANGIRQISPYDATNGYAYMLQDVLRPAWLNRNLLATVATSALPTLASLLVTTDLDGALSNPDAALTVFAPSEQAFADMGDALLNYLQSSDGLATLTDILLYHVVDDLLPTLRLPTVSTPVVTLAGAELLLVPGTPYMVNGLTNTARITTPDMFARNGVLHIIDNVLLFGSILPSLVEIVASQDELSDLEAALAASGDDIANALSGAGPFFLLAPTNAALAAMDTQLAAVLFSEPGWLAHLQSFLLHHVTTQVGTTGELIGADTTFVMLSGEAVRARGDPLILSPSFGFPCNVETADFRGLNGYVSTITRALAPSWSTESLFDVIETSTTMMASFLEAADLATTLRAERDLMVFAPTNQAFMDLPAGRLDFLGAPENVGDLTSLLQNHIVEGIISSQSIPQGITRLTSRSGSPDNIVVFKDGDNIFVDTFAIVTPDLLAFNGIVHTLDGVIQENRLETIYEFIASGETITDGALSLELSILAGAVSDLGLSDVLDGSGPFTVFAPSDRAIQDLVFALSARGITEFFQEPEWILHLDNFVKFHVATGQFNVADISSGTEIPMLNGESVTVTKNEANGGASFGPAFSVLASSTGLIDNELHNGVVHISRRGLTPAFIGRNLVDLALVEAQLLAQLIVEASLDMALTSGDFTVFAPTDNALLSLGDELNMLRQPSNVNLLRTILTYHVVPSVIPSASIAMGSSVSLNTLAGESIEVQKTMAGAVVVNGAAVVLPDRLANNGLMHLINQVLEPPNLTSTPTQSPIDIPAGDRVDDTIATFSILSTLGSLLTTSGLTDDLSTFGPFTVFAPSNTAFNNLPAGRLTKYRQPQYIQHLRSYLNFHVYVGDLPTSSTALTMRNGDDVALQVTGSALSIQNNIVQATTPSANGQVLLISTVLTPPFFSESLASILSEEYSILFELFTLADMASSLLAFNADLTIFAPTNAAFEALGDQLEDLKQPSNLDQLTTILNYHIISTVVPRVNIPMGTSTLATVTGTSRTIVRNAAIFVDDVPVILPDQLALNGIVHGLNAVLLPPAAVLVVNTGEFEPDGLESGAVTYQWHYWVATTLGLWATVTLFV